MNTTNFIWRFTPSRTDPVLLEAIFVQREALLTNVLERVNESATTGNKHQMLLIGPRGFGKTHFVSLLWHRVIQNPTLSRMLRIAWLNEDETTTSFIQLLMRIYRALVETYPEDFSSELIEDLFALPPAEIEQELKTILIEAFADKTILLIVENLDALFDGLGDLGQKKWRSFLQEHPITCTVATTQKLFAGVSRRQSPFFGFFDPMHLKPLSVDEARQLLHKIAEQSDDKDLQQYIRTPEGRSRVRTLHHLAGGNHRIYIVLSDFITRDSLDELVGPFEKMLDELTPFYQERMRWLSPQQRQIVEFLCTRTAPCPAKVIARHLFAAENTMGGQLKKLRDLGYVTSTSRGRESLYELTEPLMRLSYEVKKNRREPMRLIVDFLRIWYRPVELTEQLQQASNDTLRAHISAAIDKAETSDDLLLQVIQDAIDMAKSESQFEEAIEALEEKAHAVNTPSAWFELAFSLDDVKRYDDAIVCLNYALEFDPKFAAAWIGKGYSLNKLQYYDDAIVCLNYALELDPKFAVAWDNKGYSLNKLQRYDDALLCLDHALELDPKYTLAWNNKGYSLNKLQRYDDALTCFDRALELDSKYTIAWNNKGYSLNGLQRYDDAIYCYEQALAINPGYTKPVFKRCEPLFALHRWEPGFTALRHAFTAHGTDPEDDTLSIIHIIHRSSDGLTMLRDHVRELISIYSDHNHLPRLGDGLVRSLTEIDTEMLSEKALNAWRDIWLEEGAGHLELGIPLRIFKVGIAYLSTPDERVLLDLVSTERAILRQALGLEPES
ncbi:tetratricopeptide repeat protein [Candidatus Entotheonella palauensis]|nr:tetratricopeptide repeat protein [Candidatus Entotheonella palauensis]